MINKNDLFRIKKLFIGAADRLEGISPDCRRIFPRCIFTTSVFSSSIFSISPLGVFSFGTLLLAVLLSSLSAASAQTSNLEREARIKAATIYYIAKFVAWPEKIIAERPHKLLICTVGKSPIEHFLPETLKGKEVAGRPLQSQEVDVDDDLSECDIVYIGESSQDFTGKLAKLEQDHIVTISSDRLANAHPVVYLFNEQNKLRMEINLQSAKRVGVQFSSELLQVSKIVP